MVQGNGERPSRQHPSYDDVDSAKSQSEEHQLPDSLKENNGSVRSWPDRSSMFRHDVGPSSSTSTESMSPPTTSKMLSRFLEDDGIWNPTPSRWSSSPEAIEAHHGSMKSYLDACDQILRTGHGTVPSGPSSIRVFPARTRLPGEQPPYRLEDGENATQPRRRPRGDAQSNHGSTPSEVASNPDRPPRSRREVPPSINRTSNFDSSELLTSSNRKGKANVSFTSSQTDVIKQSSRLSPSNIQQKRPFSSKGLFVSFGDAPPPLASCQHADQSPRGESGQSGLCQSSPSPSQLPEPSVLLPNNVVWQPHLGLFAPDRQHPSAASQAMLTANPGSTMENTSSKRPRLHWPAPSCNSAFGTMQNAYVPNQNPVGLYRFPAQMSSQEISHNSVSTIPSLTFDSSSSQTRSSPFDSSSNHSPPPLFKAPGDQPEEPLPPLDMPHRWHYVPEGLLPERDRGNEGAEADEEIPDPVNDWEDWVNYDSDRAQE